MDDYQKSEMITKIIYQFVNCDTINEVNDICKKYCDFIRDNPFMMTYKIRAKKRINTLNIIKMGLTEIQYKN